MRIYQDWAACPEKEPWLVDAIETYRSSGPFRRALEAEQYFRGENPAIARKTLLQARKIETRDEHGRKHVRSGVEDVVGNRIGSSFLYRFVCQENQMLLQNGCCTALCARKTKCCCKTAACCHPTSRQSWAATLTGSWSSWGSGHWCRG